MQKPQAHKKARPAGAGGGAGRELCAWLGANGYSHFTPSRPACQALFARWLAQARACADADYSIRPCKPLETVLGG